VCLEEYNYYKNGCHQPANRQEDNEIPNINKPYEWCIYMLCKIRDQAIVDHDDWENNFVVNSTTWKKTEERIKDHYLDPLQVYEESLAKELLDIFGNMIYKKNINRTEYTPARPQINLKEQEALDEDEENQIYYNLLSWPSFNYRRKHARKQS
jgi:hypothetical protein